VRKLSAGAPLALVVALALNFVLDAPVTGASRPSTVSRTSSLAYPGCPTRAVTVTVTVPRAPVPSGVPVRYTVTLRNTSSETCGPPKVVTTVSGRSGLAASLQMFGQCGMFPVVIEDRHGGRVYPPLEAVLCPLDLPPKLAPGATVTTSQTWNQVEVGGRPARRAQLAPSGTYHVTIASRTRATFVLGLQSGG
jgi:hypothetical protein